MYPSGSATTSETGDVHASLLSDVGNDVWLFVSGGIGEGKSSTKGAVLFGGDVVISGSIYGSQVATYDAEITSDDDIILKLDRPFLNSLLFFEEPHSAQENLIKLSESSISIEEYLGRSISFQYALNIFKEEFANFLKIKMRLGSLSDWEIRFRGQWLKKCRL